MVIFNNLRNQIENNIKHIVYQKEERPQLIIDILNISIDNVIMMYSQRISVL